jgi:hypothetical protein
MDGAAGREEGSGGKRSPGLLRTKMTNRRRRRRRP